MIVQASMLVLICSKRGRLNHRSVFKKCGHFLKRFLTSKIPLKPTALSPPNLFVIYLKFSYWTDLQLPIQSLSCWYYYFNKEV